MEFRISDEQRAMVSAVRAVAQKEFRARAPQYIDGSFP